MSERHGRTVGWSDRRRSSSTARCWIGDACPFREWSHWNSDRRWDRGYRPKRTCTLYLSNEDAVITHGRKRKSLCTGRLHNRGGLCKAERNPNRAAPVFDCDKTGRHVCLHVGATSRTHFDYAFRERMRILQIVGIHLDILATRRERKGTNGGVIASKKERAIQIGSSKLLFHHLYRFPATFPPLQ